MHVIQIELRHFRGFENARIVTNGQVVAIGEPRGGRSDLIEGLTRALSADVGRMPLTDDLDFHRRDTSRRAEVEVVIGGLGPELEQLFFDALEFWDSVERRVVDEVADLDEIDRSDRDVVVRLCYRAEWAREEEQANQWVDYPKLSDPEVGEFRRVRRSHLQALPFQAVREGTRPLGLGPRAHFRRLVELAEGRDFPEALERLGEEMGRVTGDFATSEQVGTALEAVVAPAGEVLGLTETDALSELIRFMPEGGSLGGLLRALSPALDLRDEAGHLPLGRHGSTATAILLAGEALAGVVGRNGVVAMDDFGEGLDAGSARHLAASVRRAVSQAWISTRRPAVAEAFRPSEIVRLARERDGRRGVFQGREAATKAERQAARHLSLQLLPAATSKALVILEGPHDRAAYEALAERLFEEENIVLPAGRGIALAHAGAVDGSGGSSGVPRLAGAARDLGFRVVSVIDHDRPGAQIEAELQANLEAADAVVRLPRGYAVEKALVDGLSDDALRDALRGLEEGFGARLRQDAGDLRGRDLAHLAVEVLKSAGGLHAQFVGLLASSHIPPVARRALEAAIDAALGNQGGHIQL